MRTCSVDGCVKPVHSRGWCGMHYERWRLGRGVGGPDLRVDHRTVMERVAEEHTITAGGCLVFTGGRPTRSGHIQVWDEREKKRRGVHRVVWERLHGTVPAGLVVRHSCDNPPCVNPDHLLLGTVADNNRDRDERGRHVALRGVDNGYSKLTESDVYEIRHLAAIGAMPQTAIGERFGITQGAVHCIHARKTWAHLPDRHYVAELKKRGAA